jgi:hypothetical protein
MAHISRWLGYGVLLMFAVPATLIAQSSTASPAKLVPGSSAVDGSFLKPYKNAWKVVYEFPGKEPFLIGTWTDELSEVELNGRNLLKRYQMADYAKYGIVSTYVNVFDPKTMVPVYSDFTRSDTRERAHREFDGAKVTYRKTESADEGKVTTGEIKLPEPVFDYNGGLYGVLLAALPLKEGFEAQLPTLSEDRDELDLVTLKVGKQELTDAGPGKQVMAWPVDTEGNYANHSHSIFWITKDPPYVIKLVTFIPSAKWVRITISMI